ncbi:hypothetical protein ACT4ML_10160 [Natrinema sp. LN54]|uniref:hypothetical protein n=1 Tax=Natrinema sp. LN54 TaxID=3458705 RepID=UPI0040367364
MKEPAYAEKDIVITESPPGYDADPYAGIILEILDVSAGEFETRLPDGTATTLSEHYGEKVSKSDPVYRIHDLVLIDGDLKSGTTTYTVPEGALRHRDQ